MNTVEFDPALFETCKWCNGGGKEPDGHYPCPDCEGTGMKGGKYAQAKYDSFFSAKIGKTPSQEEH